MADTNNHSDVRRSILFVHGSDFKPPADVFMN